MHYIGNNNFKKSISLYLKKYKYKNTITSMLWECFDEVTKLKISILMNEWINFSGHPLLSIDIKLSELHIFLLYKSQLIYIYRIISIITDNITLINFFFIIIV